MDKEACGEIPAEQGGSGKRGYLPSRSWAPYFPDRQGNGRMYYYREIVGDEPLASSIPYPKEEKSLPLILSRKELLRLFDAAPNPKHRLILRLIYGSELRRNELIKLRIRDIETNDGKKPHQDQKWQRLTNHLLSAGKHPV